MAAQVAPLTSKFGKLGKAASVGLGAVAVGGALAGKALFNIGKEFDDAFDTIRTQTGATGKRLAGLEGDFKAVVSDVPADFDVAAQAVAGLNQRLGVTGKPLQHLSKQLLELSRLTGTDIGENVASTTRLFKDWSVKTRDQSATLDKLFRLTQSTGISIGDLSRFMVQFGSPLRQLGLNFDFTAAMFAKFEREGVNTATLLPGLRFAIKAFSGATAATTADLKKWGVSLTDPEKALQQVMALIKAAPTDLKANAIAFEVFGQRAGPDMAAAIREGRFKLDDLLKSMRGGNATILGTAKATNDASENFKILSNRLKVLLEPAASAVFKGMGDLALALSKLNFDKLRHDLGLTKGDLQGIGQAFKVFGQVFGVVFRAAALAIRGFIQGFKGSVQVIRGVVEIITGLLTLKFGKAWKGVRDIFHGGIAVMVGSMRQVTAPMRAITGRVADALGNPLTAVWHKIRNAFKDATQAILSMLRRFAGGVAVVAAAIASPFVAVANAVRTVVQFIVHAVQKATRALGDLKSKIPSISLPSLPDVTPGVNVPLIGGQQRGGTIVPGSGSGDKVPLHIGGRLAALVESGELVSVANRKATAALMAVNSEVPRFAKGGIAPITLGGSGGIHDMGQAAINRVRRAGNQFIGKHRPKRAGVTGVGGGNIVALGRSLQKAGYEVGEHPAFGGVNPVHVAGSYHYSGRAIDVNDDSPPFASGSGEPGSLDRLFARLKKMRGIVELLWRVPHHFDHLHVAMQRGGIVQALQKGGVAGFASGHYTVKGAAADAQQKNTAAQIMRVIQQVHANRLASEAILMAATQESVMGKAGNTFQLTGPKSGSSPGASAYDQGLAWMKTGFYGKGGGLSLSHKLSDPGAIAQAVEGSAFPSAYSPWKGEADRWIAGWGGGAGAAPTGVSSGTGVNTPKLSDKQRKRLKHLKDVIKKLGLHKPLQDRLALLTGDSERFAELADHAGQLSDDTTQAVLQGANQAGWLQKELGTLFSLRNALIRAQEVIQKARDKIAKLLDRAGRKKLSPEERRKVQAQLTAELKKPKRRQDPTRIAHLRAKLASPDVAKALIDTLTGKDSTLSTQSDDLGSSLGDVQGLTSPAGKMGALSPQQAVQSFGGQIFDVAKSLIDLGSNKAVTDTGVGSEQADLLRQLLQQANLRTSVSEAQFPTLRDFPVPPYAGSFAEGGVVAGPPGAPRTITAHGGEEYLGVGASRSPNVIQVVVEDGAVDHRRIRVIANEETKVEMRRQTRGGNRPLAGRAGGLT